MAIWIKRAFIVFACILLAYLIGFAALIYLKHNWAEHYMGEIDLAIHHRENSAWGEQVNLVPEVFEFASKLKAVETKLKAQNYELVSPDTVWQRYQEKILDGGRVYLRRTNDFTCNLDNYVFTKFDENDQLISATATQHEAGCF